MYLFTVLCILNILYDAVGYAVSMLEAAEFLDSFVHITDTAQHKKNWSLLFVFRNCLIVNILFLCVSAFENCVCTVCSQ